MADFANTATVTPTGARIDLTKTGAPAGFVVSYSVILPSGQTVNRSMSITLTPAQTATLTQFLAAQIGAVLAAEGLAQTP